MQSLLCHQTSRCLLGQQRPLSARLAVPTSAKGCGRSRGALTVVSGTSTTYNVEVLVADGEPVDEAIKRFRYACREANIVQEMRRRVTFENPQDRIKRKTKEKHMRKKFAKRNKREPLTFADTEQGQVQSPFADQFGGPEDDDLLPPLNNNGAGGPAGRNFAPSRSFNNNFAPKRSFNNAGQRSSNNNGSSGNGAMPRQ